MTSNSRIGRKVFASYTFKYQVLWRRVSVWHCDSRGRPVLIGDASWRTVSGIYIRLGKRIYSFQWRGFMR